MLGGGTFTAQNKILPGSYINFISQSINNVNAQDRGVAAIGLNLNWGVDSKIFTVTASDMQKDPKSIFGYNIDADEMQDIREIFRHAKKLVTYKLNSGGVKASSTVANALYSGTRGNDLSVKIAANADDASKFDVTTYLGTSIVDTQTVAAVGELVSNDYVSFTSLALAAGTTKLTGGTNGTASGTTHQAFLDELESYDFNDLGVATSDDVTKALYVSYTKRMRDSLGKKFQLVAFTDAADYEGVINVINTVSDEGAEDYALVYWTLGAAAGCKLNESCKNMAYDGEYTVVASYTQTQLEQYIKQGKFVFHTVVGEVRVLEDINSLITYTKEKGEIFSSNDTMRTIDDIATEVSTLFNNSYIGKVRNDKKGRTMLWSGVVDIHKSLEQLGAIEDFKSSDITIEAGSGKGDVVMTENIKVTGSFDKLYMTVVIA